MACNELLANFARLGTEDLVLPVIVQDSIVLPN